jgi:hypothetical protein
MHKAKEMKGKWSTYLHLSKERFVTWWHFLPILLSCFTISTSPSYLTITWFTTSFTPLLFHPFWLVVLFATPALSLFSRSRSLLLVSPMSIVYIYDEDDGSEEGSSASGSSVKVA